MKTGLIIGGVLLALSGGYVFMLRQEKNRKVEFNNDCISHGGTVTIDGHGCTGRSYDNLR